MLLVLEEMVDECDLWSYYSFGPCAQNLFFRKNRNVTWRSLEVNELYWAKNQKMMAEQPDLFHLVRNEKARKKVNHDLEVKCREKVIRGQ